MNNIFRSWAIVFGLSVAAPAPIDLDPPASYQAIAERLLRLEEGEKFEGIRLPDNHVFMRDWVYRRSVAGLQRGQHVLVLFNGSAEKAVAWVEPGGVPIKVPSLPSDVDQSLDRAIDLEGEEYRGEEVAADGKIYMFRFKAAAW